MNDNQVRYYTWEDGEKVEITKEEHDFIKEEHLYGEYLETIGQDWQDIVDEG